MLSAKRGFLRNVEISNQPLTTSFDPNDMGPRQGGSFWSHLSPVQLDSKSKIKNQWVDPSTIMNFLLLSKIFIIL